MGTNLNRVAMPWAAIGGIVFFVWLILQQKPVSVARAATVQQPAFPIGETLNYRIDWQRYTGAGTAQLQVVDRGNFYGAPAWHFRATVHSAQPIRALYPMDDQIDSYSLLAGLVSRQYQEHFREFGKPEDTDAALVSAGEASTGTAPRVIVPLNTRDALSAIYLLRVTDWRRTQQLSVPVFDGENVYEMNARAAKRSTVHVAKGDYEATKIEIRLFDGTREVPDEHFGVWLADDSAHTPLLCQADLSVGAVRIELTSDTASVAGSGPKPVSRPAGSNPRAGN